MTFILQAHSNILHLYLFRSCLTEKANPTEDILLPWSPLWLRTTLELLLRRNTDKIELES